MEPLIMQEVCAAVLLRGIADLRNKRIVVRREASRWVKGLTADDPFDFESLCNVFDWDAEWLRTVVLTPGFVLASETIW